MEIGDVAFNIFLLFVISGQTEGWVINFVADWLVKGE